jgi:uracil phosphoribosyltransferase
MTIKINNLGRQHSIFNQFMAEIRNVDVQTDSMRFRRNLERVGEHMPDETTLWVGAVDSELTSRSYIVPGLGDAGDLAYGSKE